MTRIDVPPRAGAISPPPVAVLSRLRRFNAVMGALHAVQAVAVILLANTFALPITATYVSGPPGTTPGPVTVLAEVPLAAAVVAFLVVSALAHWWIAGPGSRRYAIDLGHERNIARWVEYSISSTIMMVAIAHLCGVTDAAALLAISGCNISMILFGWLQEQYEQPGGGGWLPFIFGCLAGLVPWLVVVLAVLAPGSTPAVSPPGFVYAIIISLFVFFNVFALNQWLQYRRVGPWRDYLFGERVYIWLSLVAKSALAWQVFAGALAA
ncbi:MAG: heliorhodopsin HeR [Kineosporiaceae bacterium]|nr:heliorhodopsin HeR [Kineosporiaceae bacterium]